MTLHKRYPKRVAVQVKQIMSGPAVTLRSDCSLEDAARQMVENKVGSVVIVDGAGMIVGLATERDIIYAVSRGLFEKSDKRPEVASIMSKNVVTIDPGESVLQAVEKMRSHNIKHLVVTSSAGKPEGVISLRDVLDASLEFLGILEPPP